MARLREIDAEYRSRSQAEQEAEQARMGPEAKVATVNYSTGRTRPERRRTASPPGPGRRTGGHDGQGQGPVAPA
jgi:hypothetical protein